MGGMDAGVSSYDETRAIESCQSACAPYAEACGGDCAGDCDSSTRLSSAEDCPAEFDRYYGCIAAASAADFDCGAGDTVEGNPVASCGTDWTAYSQCRRTRGFECVILTRNASACTALGAERPNWVTCKVGELPPAANDCVELNDTDYCCAAE